MNKEKMKVVENNLHDWCIENNCQYLLDEWDYEKNNLTPYQVKKSSNKKYFWKCKKGHEWEVSLSNRTGVNRNMCPICSGRKVLKGFNDLETLYPNKAAFWDYDKNSPLTPATVTVKSNRKVWWKCNNGHSYRRAIYAFVGTKNDCPECAKYQFIRGKNDLKSLYPLIDCEWDYDKNEIFPSDITPSYLEKVYWKCSNGHSYLESPFSRTRLKAGCPMCKENTTNNHISESYPDVLKDWDYKMNTVNPNSISPFSNEEYYWKCSEGHSYPMTLNDRINGHRCPYCCGKKVLVGFNDLESRYPKVAKEWDYIKNDTKSCEYTYGSTKKVWWKCEFGHSWEAAIYSRISGRRCPKCTAQFQSSFPEKAFVFYLNKVFDDVKENIKLKGLDNRELDIYIPSIKTAIEYDGTRWHKDIKKDIIKDELCDKNGIRLIRIRENGCPNYESSSIKIRTHDTYNRNYHFEDTIKQVLEILGIKYDFAIDLNSDYYDIIQLFKKGRNEKTFLNNKPELLEYWDYDKNGSLDPRAFSEGSQIKLWWKCPLGHSFQQTLSVMTRESTKIHCPYCSNKKILEGYNDLATKYPKLADEWDYEKNKIPPTKARGTLGDSKYWFICPKCGESYKTSVYSRVKFHTNCPYCGHHKARRGIDSIKALYPKMIEEEWDYEKNRNLNPDDILPASEKEVWWKCAYGHSYKRMVAVKIKYKPPCPICTNRKLLVGYNDLLTKEPYLSKEWDYEKNKKLKPENIVAARGSHRKIYWKCIRCGYSWNTALSQRLSQNTGCPNCGNNVFKKQNNIGIQMSLKL